MMEKLRGIVLSPQRFVTVEAMNEAIAAAAVAGECPAHLKLDKHRRSLALYGLVAQRLRGDPELLAVARGAREPVVLDTAKPPRATLAHRMAGRDRSGARRDARTARRVVM